MKDTKNRLSHVTIILHWLIAIAFIILIAVGLYMEKTESFKLYPIHKSIGIIVFIFVLLRVIWRYINGWLEPVNNYSTFERVLSKIVVWLLIIGTILFPLSGMIMSAAGGFGLAIFGFELFPPNLVNGEILAINRDFAKVAKFIHGEIAPPIMIGAIVLHIIGAYKHHIIDKDNTLLRMLGRNRD